FDRAQMAEKYSTSVKPLCLSNGHPSPGESLSLMTSPGSPQHYLLSCFHGSIH
ncbi:hypothetical protein DNTS_008181, partial [Danionella cerebrum]